MKNSYSNNWPRQYDCHHMQVWLPPTLADWSSDKYRVSTPEVSQYLELYITDPQTNWPIDNLQNRPTHWLVFRMMKEVEDSVMINETPLLLLPQHSHLGTDAIVGRMPGQWERLRRRGSLRTHPLEPPPFLTWPSCWEKQVQIQESGTRGNLPATDAGHPRHSVPNRRQKWWPKNAILTI